MKRKFRVGDRVACRKYGEGTIVITDSLWECSEGDNYPMEVRFDKINPELGNNHYLSNGRFYKHTLDPERDITLLSPRKTKRFKTII